MCLWGTIHIRYKAFSHFWKWSFFKYEKMWFSSQHLWNFSQYPHGWNYSAISHLLQKIRKTVTTNWIIKLVGWRSKVKRGDWGVDSTERPDETALLKGKKGSRSSETRTLAKVATSFLTSVMWEVEYGLSVLFGPQRRSLMHRDPIQGSLIWHKMVFVSWNTAQVFVESILCTLARKPQVQDTCKPPDGGWHSEQLEACGEIALPWRRQDSVDEVHDLQVVICKWCSFWERRA